MGIRKSKVTPGFQPKETENGAGIHGEEEGADVSAMTINTNGLNPLPKRERQWMYPSDTQSCDSLSYMSVWILLRKLM